MTLTGDTTGTASSQAGWSVTTKTDRLSTVGDNRAVATTPNDYVNKIIFQGLKTNSAFGSPSSDTYSYVVGLRGWLNSSGGNSHELAFNNSGIYRRDGATTSWGSWIKMIDSGNYTEYTVTKTGTGASGTWGISISGNAATATSATSATTATTATTANNLSGFKNTTTSATTIDSATTNGIYYVNGTSGIYNVSDGAAFVQAYSASWVAQIYQDYKTGQIAVRGKNNGTWQAWRKVLDSTNYTDYTVTKTGTGASGTWGIGISGNAATATTANRLAGFSSGGAATSCTWGNQTGTAIYVAATPAGGGVFFRDNNPSSGKVSMGIDGLFYQNEGAYACLDTNSFSSYALPLTGGTMTGAITTPYNKESIHFPSTAAAYGAGFVYGTSGNEAFAVPLKNAASSFMIVHGSDSTTWGGSTWQSAAPTLQTKNKSVYVNELIGQNVTPAYNFKVNGTSYLGGEVKISNSNADTESVSLIYDANLDCLNF